MDAAVRTNLTLTSLAELRDIVRDEMAQLQLRAALMRLVTRCLIDSVYLDLARPSVEPAAWRDTCHAVQRHLLDFQAAVIAWACELESTRT